MKFLLDTDHISILQKQRGNEFAALSARLAQCSPSDFGFPIISFHEQALGCHTYVTRARTSADVVRGYGMLARVLEDFAAAAVVLFDTNAAATFDQLVSLRVRVATMDLRIASIAIANRMTLLTRNNRDFNKVLGLSLDDWTK